MQEGIHACLLVLCISWSGASNNRICNIEIPRTRMEQFLLQSGWLYPRA